MTQVTLLLPVYALNLAYLASMENRSVAAAHWENKASRLSINSAMETERQQIPLLIIQGGIQLISKY